MTMDIPQCIEQTRLWSVLSSDMRLANAVLDLRKVAGKLGAKVAELLPDYTDHSIEHMDALWRVSREVFLPDEIGKFTVAEAFVLGCAFYVHDLGMALAATPAGLDKVRESKAYATAKASFQVVPGLSPARAELLAVRAAARDLHAQGAVDLVINPLPGIDTYLIDNTDLRRVWGTNIGEVAASHHWTIAELHARLGKRIVPTDTTGQLDLAFVACALRLIDYAHVNHERAPHVDRVLRSEISPESVTHWNAQEYIAGPSRSGDWLVYASTTDFKDMDAWWLFYDVARGLDVEIRAVRDYVDERPSSRGRLSLRGVRGAASAANFAELVQLGGRIMPIDIRIQPESMDRLVDMLGGKALYGDDSLAPIRELLQNARDAVELRRALAVVDGVPCAPGLIEVALWNDANQAWLSIKDNGVGMSRSVITKHLIGVASDFWHSVEFFRDYGRAIEKGFKPIGRFGIGFLSVFMLGDQIEVETEGLGGRYRLRLRGVGRRGELTELPSNGNRGTIVRIALNPDKAKELSQLEGVVRARAPMLEVPIKVKWTDEGSPREASVIPGWWKHLADGQMEDFLKSWRVTAWYGGAATKRPSLRFSREFVIDYGGFEQHSGGEYDLVDWPGLKPRVVSDDQHILSSGGMPSPGILRCSKGIAVDIIECHELFGMLEMGEVELNAARDSSVEVSAGDRGSVFASKARGRRGEGNVIASQLQTLRKRMKAEVIGKLNDLERHGMLPSRLALLRLMASLYGVDVLLDTSLRWVPTVEPPGDTVHRSHSEVVAKVSEEDRVMCGIGIGPRNGYSLLKKVIGKEACQTRMITIGVDEFDVGYSLRSELERTYKDKRLDGPLADICRTANVDMVRLVLLSAVIRMVAEAWHTKPRVLKEQKWILDFSATFLLAVLERPASSP